MQHAAQGWGGESIADESGANGGKGIEADHVRKTQDKRERRSDSNIC